MRELKVEINACISNIDKVCDTIIVGYQNFKITLWYMIKFWDEQTAAFLTVSVNSALEKYGYLDKGFNGTLSSKCKLMCQSWAELKVWWRACQKSFNSIYRYLLSWMTSMAGNLHLLTQFIRSQYLLFLDMISWISHWKMIFLFSWLFLWIFSSPNLTWISNVCLVFYYTLCFTML